MTNTYGYAPDGGATNGASMDGGGAPQMDAEEATRIAMRFEAFHDADPDRLVVIPPDANLDAHRPILERMGAPLEASAYNLDKLEGADPELAKHWGEVFVNARLLPWQVASIAKSQMEFARQQGEAELREAQIEADREMQSLHEDWAGKHTENTELGRRAARYVRAKMGKDAAEAISYLESAIGPKNVMQLFAHWGRLMQESSFVEGERPGSAPAPKGDLAKRMYPNA